MKRSANRFGPMLLVLALPALAVLVFYGWQYVARFVPPSSAGPSEAPARASLADQVRLSGIRWDRSSREKGTQVFEISGDPAKEAKRFVAAHEGSRSSRRGSDVLVETSSGERFLLRHFVTVDSGAGLEEAAAEGSEAGEIALILDDVGFDNQPVHDAMSIHRNLNFSILPGNAKTAEYAALLDRNGYELMLHLPMEPESYPRESPGSGAVLTSMSDEEIRAAVRQDLAAVPHARGMNNHMGSKATADRRVMEAALSALPPSAYFVDSRTTVSTIAEQTARDRGIRTAPRDVFLDDVREEGAVRGQLARLAAIARERGRAIGIGHMYPVTIRVLREEVPRLEREGYRFVRVSRVVR